MKECYHTTKTKFLSSIFSIILLISVLTLGVMFYKIDFNKRDKYIDFTTGWVHEGKSADLSKAYKYEYVSKMILSYPGIRFNLISNGKSILYAHDTGYFLDETWEYIENSGIVFDSEHDCGLLYETDRSGLDDCSCTHACLRHFVHSNAV